MNLFNNRAAGLCLSFFAFFTLLLAVSTFLTAYKPYSSLWFFAGWIAVATVIVIVMARTRMWKRIGSFTLHFSILIILAGGALSAIWGERGTLELYPDRQPVQFWLTAGSYMPRRLPEAITLDSVEAVKHSGYATNYRCFISLASGRKAVLSVNNPVALGKYRLCLASSKVDGATILSVNHDPACGSTVTYVGYILFLVGFLLIMTTPNGPYRRLLRNLTDKSTV
ncbi:MAG: cytochrome c biogenesis protein ResB [Bacteroides sp.]|nr:cytochrome c biogenesis protein ResB [Bacteroides sp.]